MATRSGKRHAQEVRAIKIREAEVAQEVAQEDKAYEAWRVHRLAQLGVKVLALKN